VGRKNTQRLRGRARRNSSDSRTIKDSVSHKQTSTKSSKQTVSIPARRDNPKNEAAGPGGGRTQPSVQGSVGSGSVPSPGIQSTDDKGCDTPDFGQIFDVDLLSLCARKESVPLSSAEEKACIKRIKAGDKDEQNRFLNANVRLIISRVKKFCPLSDHRASDLLNEGALGLIRALEDFDPDKKFKFSTYAVWWIDAHIRKGLKFFKKETVVSPDTMKKKYETGTRVLLASTGEYPTPEEVAKYLRWTPDDLRTFQRIGGNQRVVVHGIDETLPCLHNTYSKKAENRELVENISNVLSKLTPAEEDIVRRRFGIGLEEEETLVQIAAFYGLAKERIRQIETYALRKLYVHLRKRNIDEERKRAED